MSFDAYELEDWDSRSLSRDHLFFTQHPMLWLAAGLTAAAVGFALKKRSKMEAAPVRVLVTGAAGELPTGC